MKNFLAKHFYLLIVILHALFLWTCWASPEPTEEGAMVFMSVIGGLALVIWWSARRTFKAEDHVRAINARGPLRKEDQDEAKYAITEFPKATHSLALNFTVSSLICLGLFCKYPTEWGFLIWTITFALGSLEHWSLYKELMKHERV